MERKKEKSMTMQVTSGPENDFSGDCDLGGTSFRCSWADRAERDDGTVESAIHVDCPVCGGATYAFRAQAQPVSNAA